MLWDVAEFYEGDLDLRLTQLTTWIEPVGTGKVWNQRRWRPYEWASVDPPHTILPSFTPLTVGVRHGRT
jgi:hypothetical protein